MRTFLRQNSSFGRSAAIRSAAAFLPEEQQTWLQSTNSIPVYPLADFSEVHDFLTRVTRQEKKLKNQQWIFSIFASGSGPVRRARTSVFSVAQSETWSQLGLRTTVQPNGRLKQVFLSFPVQPRCHTRTLQLKTLLGQDPDANIYRNVYRK